MKNERTPRCLADATFTSGYRSVERDPVPPFDRWAGRLLAVLIGIGIAVVAMYGG